MLKSYFKVLDPTQNGFCPKNMIINQQMNLAQMIGDQKLAE